MAKKRVQIHKDMDVLVSKINGNMYVHFGTFALKLATVTEKQEYVDSYVVRNGITHCRQVDKSGVYELKKLSDFPELYFHWPKVLKNTIPVTVTWQSRQKENPTKLLVFEEKFGPSLFGQ